MIRIFLVIERGSSLESTAKHFHLCGDEDAERGCEMGNEESTAPDSRSAMLAKKAEEVRAHFIAELRAGRSPQEAIYRALIASESDWVLEPGEEPDSQAFRS